MWSEVRLEGKRGGVQGERGGMEARVVWVFGFLFCFFFFGGGGGTEI
jgi:hypothetical protein